ncbi:MAG: acyl-CoA dehydrogenase family protein [Dehalococcoidia bacterium]
MHSLADAERAFRALLIYVRAEVRDGVPLAQIPWVRAAIADLWAEIHAATLLLWQLTWLQETGQDTTKQAAALKIVAAEVQERTLSLAIDIVGPEGVLESWGADTPGVPMQGLLPELYRSTRNWFIAGGANEIKRNIIAQRGLGLPRG